MQFGLSLCNHGEYADPVLLADLAVEAEAAGWDGVFVWDHVARGGEPAMTDPTVALAAIATRTQRVTIGPLVTPLARRRPHKVARESVALDRLSGGRTVLGVGLGLHPEEFEQLGEVATPRERAALLDEALDVITELWSGERVDHHGAAFDVAARFEPGPVQRPRIPIWVGGSWPRRAPLRRAARFDGFFPVRGRPYDPADYVDMAAAAAEHRPTGAAALTFAHEGAGTPRDIERWPEYAAVGVSWWIESFRSEERGVDACRAVIAQGPPR